MSRTHGKSTVFKLDGLDGVLADLSAQVTGVQWGKLKDKPQTEGFGQNGRRYQVGGRKDGRAISFEAFLQQVASTRLHGKGTRILINEHALSGDLETVSVNRTVELPETHGFLSTGDFRERGVPGYVAGSLAFGGMFGETAAELDAILSPLVDADTPAYVAVAPQGFGVGNIVEVAAACFQDYDIPTTKDDLTKCSANAVADDGVDLGVSLHDVTAETATDDGDTVDETAATAAGGVGFLHVSAYSGLTDSDIKIQHSTNGSDWTDLITFATVTAVGAQRIEVSGTVNRYVRATWAATGVGSHTFAVVFARRSFTYGSAGTYRHYVGLVARSASSTYELGPQGSGSGAPRKTGECRLASLSATYSKDEVLMCSVEMASTGVITENTY